MRLCGIIILLLITSCSPYRRPWVGPDLARVAPDQARGALRLTFENLPVAYASRADVEGFGEFWCVIMGVSAYYLGSTQILEDRDGGWNSMEYGNRSQWESDCGPVPEQYIDKLELE